jgi:hypothetical protein
MTTKPFWSVFEGANSDLIAAAAQVWVRPDDRGMDVTWGTGRWKTNRHHRPELFTKHDLKLDGVDFRRLPEPDGSVDCIYYDPPYISRGSDKSAALKPMYDSYGQEALKGWRPTIERVEAGLKECARVLAPGGRLFAKCGDGVESGHRRFAVFAVARACKESGLTLVDLVVHQRGRPSPQPAGRQQQHSAMAHSFLLIAQKPPLVHPLKRKPKRKTTGV